MGLGKPYKGFACRVTLSKRDLSAYKFMHTILLHTVIARLRRRLWGFLAMGGRGGREVRTLAGSNAQVPHAQIIQHL
jgi:hypothetical protein